MTKQQTSIDLGLLAMRISVGLYMLLAGFGKVQSEINNGLGSFYEGSFTAMKPDWLPTVMGMPYGYALPWLEVIVGVALIIGLCTRIVGIVGLGMLVSFIIALVIKFNSITAQPDGPGGPFNANYIQCTAYLFFALAGAGRLSVDAILLKKKKS